MAPSSRLVHDERERVDVEHAPNQDEDLSNSVQLADPKFRSVLSVSKSARNGCFFGEETPTILC
jgi:hypothetical protein